VYESWSITKLGEQVMVDERNEEERKGRCGRCGRGSFYIFDEEEILNSQ
jgi:hypothetical protein